jgi:hypothetical protein
MIIVDRLKNTIINLEGSWHMTISDSDVWIFPSLDSIDIHGDNTNYYRISYKNVTKEELLTKFANKTPRFNLSIDVEVIM